MGIRKRKQMVAAPILSPIPSSQPEYVLPISGKIFQYFFMLRDINIFITKSDYYTSIFVLYLILILTSNRNLFQ